MLKSYLKISLRNIKRSKTYSVINILGLSVGIACSILIFLWIHNELSYDHFHKNAGQIYRVVAEDPAVGKMANTCGPLANYLKNNYPDVVNATRYMSYSGSSFKYGDEIFHIGKGAFADPSFFRVFSFEFLQGDPKTALSNISDIVITQSMAERFFGKENPVGKTILVDGKSPMIITAVLKDPPANSTLQFNFLLNTLVLKSIGFPLFNWSGAGLYTFIQVRKSTDIRKLNTQISGIMSQQVPGFNRELFLQPLTGIHLNTAFSGDFSDLGDIKYIYIFSAIALFLILIASINHINLTTARVLKRSKEVGLRKIMGANRLQVIKQFFGESLIIVIISFVLAAVWVEILLPVFDQISGKGLTANYHNPTIFFGIAVLLVIVSLISGGYPALFLSSTKPVNTLKDMLGERQRGSSFRKILVVVQFALAITLIAGTTVVYYQLDFIRNKKLGFDKENVLYIDAKGNFLQNYQTIKHELLSQSSITGVTAEDRLLTNSANSTTNVNWEGKNSKTFINFEYSYVDYNYFNMLHVAINRGRNFSKAMRTDQSAFILNQEAVDQMKLKQPVGAMFSLNNVKGRIIGVIKNTNFRSLYHKVNPTAYIVLRNYSTLSFQYNGIIYIKTAPGKTRDAIAAIGKIWKEANPDLPFEYHFLDKTIDSQYHKDVRTGEIFSWFSLIAIFISCMGLYGLTVFMTEQRTKEIGIRKVLGASVLGITARLSSDFLKLVGIGFVIAVPIAWIVMHRWLENFAYHISISAGIFVLAGILAMIIALGTVSWQSVKAAIVNPMESLRNE